MRAVEEGAPLCGDQSHNYIGGDITNHVNIQSKLLLQIMLIYRANRQQMRDVINNSPQTLTDGLRRCKNISFVITTLDTSLNPI